MEGKTSVLGQKELIPQKQETEWRDSKHKGKTVEEKKGIGSGAKGRMESDGRDCVSLSIRPLCHRDWYIHSYISPPSLTCTPIVTHTYPSTDISHPCLSYHPSHQITVALDISKAFKESIFQLAHHAYIHLASLPHLLNFTSTNTITPQTLSLTLLLCTNHTSIRPCMHIEQAANLPSAAIFLNLIAHCTHE